MIADLFPIQQRGLANAMFVLGPLFGPVIGPIIGGFIAERAGWRVRQRWSLSPPPVALPSALCSIIYALFSPTSSQIRNFRSLFSFRHTLK